ncbi:hypothetical protein ACIQU1_10540 [Streptomyces angustmyceticus]
MSSLTPRRPLMPQIRMLPLTPLLPSTWLPGNVPPASCASPEGT